MTSVVMIPPAMAASLPNYTRPGAPVSERRGDAHISLAARWQQGADHEFDVTVIVVVTEPSSAPVVRLETAGPPHIDEPCPA